MTESFHFSLHGIVFFFFLPDEYAKAQNHDFDI